MSFADTIQVQSSAEEGAVEAVKPQISPGILGDLERKILAFERQWWKYPGAKEASIRELFDMTSTRYYQVLNSIIDEPEALAIDPMLVKRLRRMRSSRQKARSARRLGTKTDA